MASDAQGIPLVLHPRHEWRYIDAEVYPDREVTHVAHALDAASVALRRELLAGINPEAWMLNAGYRMGIETALKELGLGGDDA